ncbi:MAG: hypothetical protein WCW14_04485, partial [Candidatus Paceibacterota bacterium]
RKAGNEQIKLIRKASMFETGSDKSENNFKYPNPTKGQIEKIAAIERSQGKYPFDTMIRAVYLTEDKTKFDSNTIGGITGMFRAYNSNYLNRFSLCWRTDFNNAKYYGKRGKEIVDSMKTKVIEAYKRRSFFQFPFKDLGYRKDFVFGVIGYLFGYLGYDGGNLEKDQDAFILGTDELASIYHFPSSTAQTPTLARITSRKSEAPPNLPI